ncbi:MAG: phosphoribosylformylglycinamidine synthase, partial [Candidatus Eisenbacteria bacterium]|nr:phosphoribosylformylglycinamidine synthase [Candidatus Eisenbacteria bacterium]
KIDAYQGGASSVAESMRNVAAVGATPWCLTDCLNYGSPEDPKVFRQFKDGVQGVADAARGIGMIGEENVPIPIVSGNVSFYNEATGGKAVPPSPIVACFGVMEDYANALTMGFKSEGNTILLLGRRMRELGGSAYWRLLRRDHGAVPQVSFRNVRAEISTLLKANDEGWVAAAHDISEGGILVAAAEMALASGEGCRLEIEEAQRGLRADEFLFSETGGFLVEVPEEHVASVKTLAAKHDVSVVSLGEVTRDAVLDVSTAGRSLLRMDIQELKPQWEDALEEVMA